MYGTQNIDLQVITEHGLDTEEWIWKWFSPIKEMTTETEMGMKFLPDGSLRPLDKSNIKETLGRCKKAELNEKFDLGFSEKELTKTKKETLVQIASEIRINKWEEG